MMVLFVCAVLLVLTMVGIGSAFSAGSASHVKSRTAHAGTHQDQVSPRTRIQGKRQVQQLQVTPGREQTHRQPARLPKVRPYAKIFQMYSRTLDELDAQDPK